MTENLLSPRYAEPADLPEIESVPPTVRGLPESTYSLRERAAQAGKIGVRR
ncbi:hypothetical protein [Nocardia barduliensis]|uniref:hypothetical protein n=1 Tax=Nocardia barduliensis TaxID=2736643 RepID=UPI001571D8A7|nr:hypothetical protein [Nocardia barduliensis]